MALEYYTGIDHFLSYLSDPTARIYLQQSLDFWHKKDFLYTAWHAFWKIFDLD